MATHSFEMLKHSIDGVLGGQPERLRRLQVMCWVRTLTTSGIAADNFGEAVKHLPVGRALARGEIFEAAGSLYQSLTDWEHEGLAEHYKTKLEESGVLGNEMASAAKAGGVRQGGCQG